jgi:hypothetical protein
MPRTGTDIIGIEEVGVVGVEGLVTRAVFNEQKLLEKPGGMCAMPFRGTCVRHRLHDLVFGAQRRRTALGLAANGQERLHEIMGEAARIGEK